MRAAHLPGTTRLLTLVGGIVVHDRLTTGRTTEARQ